MALTIGTLQGYLRMDDAQFQAAVAGAEGRLQSVAATATAAAKTIAMGLGAGLVGVAGTAIKMSGDFEAAMNKVKAISGATGEQFTELRDMAKELGASTQFSASEAADAMGFLAMAGFKTTDIMTALPGVLDLAAAGSMDLASAADIASNILSGYGMKTEEIGRLNDVLAKTFTSANVDVRMLGESFKYVGPVASSAGLRFEEMAAAVGLLGNAGIQGSEAGTALRGSIARLLKPTDEVSSTLERLGVRVLDAKGNLLPLVDIVGQLEKAGAKTADMMTIFGLEAGPAMQALVSQGSGALRDLTASLDDAGGTAERIAKTQMEGFNGQVKELQSAFEGLMIAVGDTGLLKWATDAAKGLTDFTSALTSNESVRAGFVAGIQTVVDVAKELGSIVADRLSTPLDRLREAFAGSGDTASVLGNALRTGLVGAVTLLADTVGGLIYTLAWLIDLWNENETAILVIGGIITAVFIPHWVALGIAALVSGGKQAAAWLIAQAAAIRAAAAHSRAMLMMVVGWVRAGASAAMTGLIIANVWAGLAIRSMQTGARVAAGWAMQGAAATAAGLKVVGAWLLMAAQSVIGAAVMAASWLAAFWPIVLIVALVIGLVALIIWQWDNIVKYTKIAWEWVVGAVVAAWDWIVGAVKTGWQWIMDAFNAYIAMVRAVWTAIWSWVVAAIRGYFNAIGAVWNWLVGLASSAVNGIRERWNTMVSFVSGLPGRIRSAAAGMWDGIKTAFQSAINWIIGAWNRLSFRVPPVSVAGTEIFGGATISVPQIPMLAKGGDITTAGMAIVGDDGPEALYLPRGARVSPLPGGSSTVGSGAPEFDVRVFIGDEQLTGRIRTEIRESNRGLRRRALAGAR